MTKVNTDPQWDGKTKGGQEGYAFFHFCLKFLGLKAAYFALYFVAFFYFIFESHSRYVGKDFISKVKDMRQSLNQQAQNNPNEGFLFPYFQFIQLGKCLIDRMYYLSTDSQPPLSGLNFSELKGIEKGGLLISGHYGGWELASRLIPAFYTGTLNILMHQGESEKMQKYIDQIQGKQGPQIRILNAGDGAGVYLEIYKAIKNEEVVVMHGDRTLNQRTLELPFLGHPAYFPEDPFALAAKLQCRVYYSFVTRMVDGRYSIKGINLDPNSNQFN
ncbi:MAG: hypothetical protein HQL32_11360, partial [Planctomycetes bacterium]|nr:hypothetical protein [Planctomycetota bacterium]